MADVWASDDDDPIDYDRSIAEREWSRLHENHGNEGYKDGIIEGKEVRMQHGFDRGYKEGLAFGKALGQLRGTVCTHIAFCKQNGTPAPELEALLNDLCVVQFEHVYSKDYFSDETPSPDYISPQSHLERWQRRVDEAIAAQPL